MRYDSLIPYLVILVIGTLLVIGELTVPDKPSYNDAVDIGADRL